MNRRGFFKAMITLKKEKAMRPPYYQNEELFYSQCIHCIGKCADVCEEKIIIIEDKIPVLNFEKGGCTFCKKCAEICDQGVLNLNFIENKTLGKAFIAKGDCFAWKKIMCSNCRDSCSENAIQFDVLWNPVVERDLCNGCGWCVSSCPTNAITIEMEHQ